ncbi:hypothetical protein [Actinoplanes solisilvae]|uniref:hypothetical protein n=1 Tax=Actinoplanes solisilvae TaxID=2486853 RepID=UPI000FD8BF68|nr:hypothetical protein [Actinoplanes solisilvae]
MHPASASPHSDDGVEFGLMASFDPEAGTQGYLPYWTEWGNDTEETHPITNTPYGTLPDDRQHHYVLVTTSGGSGQYDVLYDYNPVGTTRLQEGGRYRDAFAMTTVQNPNTVSFPAAFENRLQMQNGNGIYFKPGTGQVSRSEPKTCGALPTDVDPLWDEINVAPWCLTTSLGVTGNEVQYMRVSKPNTSLAKAPAVAAPVPSSAPDVLNGVDQAKLRACVAQGESPCFDQVPGLRACVDARLVCNAAAAAVGDATAGRITGGQAKERVATRLRLTDRTKISSAANRASDLPSALRAKLPATLATTAPVTVVTGNGEVHGLSAGKDRVYQGHLTVLDGATGALVYACLGRDCPAAQ